MFNNAPDVKAAILKSIEESTALKKQLENFRKEKAQEFKAKLIASATEENGVKIYKGVLPIMPEDAKDLAFQLRAENPENALIILGTVFDDKPSLIVAISDPLVKENGMNAGKMIREAAKLIKGGGGGQPHFATAGGKDKDGIRVAIDKLVELAK
jgi:alanyl-tRNA synthetase